MTKLNELEDVTISNPKAGDVVKYTASGWVNGAEATGGGAGGNACGGNEDYLQSDKKETITETWTWEVGDECGVEVKHRDGINQLEKYAEICPGRVEVGNKNGRIQMKTFDGGNSRITAFNDKLEFYDAQVTEGVTLAELVACCDSTSSSINNGTAGVIKFKNAPTFNRSTGRQTKTAWDASMGIPFDVNWSDDRLYDIFKKETNAYTIEMPPGTDSAVLHFHYSLLMTPTRYLYDGDAFTGHANVNYSMEISSNKSINTDGNPLTALTANIRARTELIPWEQANQIGGNGLSIDERDDVVLKRAPGQSTSGQQSTRIFFEESTEDSPTRITLKPFCNVARFRGCTLTVDSGSVVVIPFKAIDGNTDFQVPSTASTEDIIQEDFNDVVKDDYVVDIAAEEYAESRELKKLMNYYTTSISETLNYDSNLDPAGIPILQGALTDLFNLKRDTTNDLEYYYNRLATIRELVAPYVAFQFGFETTNTVRTF